MSEWIEIANAPVKSGFYLLASGDKVSVGRYMAKKAEWKLPQGWFLHIKPTHWMELPLPPKVTA